MAHSSLTNGNVSFWYDEVGFPVRKPALAESLSCDVCIVGAGYTGMWTAYYLKKAAPNLRVVLLEQQFAGYGASGRNGGWLTNSVTGGRDQYVSSHGKESALAMQSAMNHTVDEVIRICELEGIDADIVKGGELNAAFNPAQHERLLEWAAEEHSWGYDDVQVFNKAETLSRITLPNVRSSIWHPHCARIQPAKLAQGLRKVILELGVELYEDTTVVEIGINQAITAQGTVHADHVIRATEGFTANLKGVHRQVLPMNSSIIMTEPLPEAVWEEIGWSGYETLGDMAHVYFYAQRTADNRIAMGGRGVPYRFGSKTDTNGTAQASTVKTLMNLTRKHFPQTQNFEFEHVWSGVLGVPRDWSAAVNYVSSTGEGSAGGYVGTGVTATNLAGRTLADLIQGKQTELTNLPWVNHHVRNWEIEPLRWIATHGLYAAYGLADTREQNSSSSHTSVIAALANKITGRH
ncbi:FAD-binding oxidoreductase [uncultured Aurantimicrobium sp.]|uniref:NAD(P)/FAD-dependent oxidoreductase n=1 Tax=uncultured Aurantimicrobium sp. TaxID=1705357 RepID=UPI002629E998|nr:FAD-binding oxidoreductase [uncultured Aurantimicrobium sp.]